MGGGLALVCEMSHRTNVASPKQPMFRDGVVKSIPRPDEPPATAKRHERGEDGGRAHTRNVLPAP